METQDHELEELLMRWEEGVLTLQEEESLAQRLLGDHEARRTLVFALMLSGEASRRGAVRQAPSRQAAARWSPGLLAVQASLAAAAVLIVALCLGWPGQEPRQPAGLANTGDRERSEPRGDGKAETQADEARIAELVKQLGDEEVAKRDEADKALRALGAAAVPSLEKAASDADAERRNRARAILGFVRIPALLKNLDAGMLAAADVEGQVEYATSRSSSFKGSFRQAEGGKKFVVEVEPAGGRNPNFKLIRTCLSDGVTVWSKQVYETAGKTLPPTLGKVLLARLERQGLGWAGASAFHISPVLLVKMARLAVQFNTRKEGKADGGSVDIVEGDLPADKRATLTVGGAQAGGMMQNGTRAGPVSQASKVRLYLCQQGTCAQQLDVLAEDGAVLWSVKLSNVKLGQKADPAAFAFTPPEGAKVTDYDANRDANR